MTRSLISVGPGGVFVSGLFTSVNKHAIPLWADGENVVFGEAEVEKAPGYQVLTTLPAEVRALEQASAQGEKRIYAATTDKVFVYRNGSLTQIGSFTSQEWPILETWGTFLLVSDKINKPLVWRNSGTTLDTLLTPFTYTKLLLRKDVFVVAANTSEGGNHIAWCSDSNIDLWDPANSNSAGDYVVRDLDGDIRAMQDLGPNIALYSGDSLVIGRYIGQPFVFSWQRALNGIGAVGPRSIVPLGSQNYGLGQQGIFVTDGIQFRYVDKPALREWITATIDLERGDAVNGYHHEALGLVVWHFRDAANNIYGVGYDPATSTCTKLNYSLLASLERDVFATPIGAVADKVVELGKGYNLGTAPMTAWVKTKPLDAGGPEVYKLWEGIRAYLRTGSTGLMRVWVIDGVDPEATPELIYSGSMTSHLKAAPPRESTYVVLEFRAEALGAFFKLSGFVVEGEPGGPNS